MLQKIFKFLISKSNSDFGILIVKFTDDNFTRIDNNYTELLQLRPHKIKFRKNPIHQIADPFLIKYNNEIWLFFEEKRIGQKGCIKSLCVSKKNSKVHSVDFNNLNSIHMSFPFVFREKRQLFMIPETADLNEIGLYRCENFPNSWVKLKTILKGNFVDTSIYKELGVYYLFTTEKVLKNGSYDYLLRLFYSGSIDDEFIEHPSSPIKSGRKFGRSGGAVVKLGDERFRFSQDCSETYGRELFQFRITMLSTVDFHEELVVNNWIKSNFAHGFGGHHCSVLLGDDNTIVMSVDLNFKESYFQRFINRLLY